MNSETASTILVVEDCSDTRQVLATLLGRYGYDVIAAEDGKDGLLKAQSVNPELILIDLAMPELDGIEATRQIRKVPALSQIPVFAISAYVTAEVRADAIAAGCTEVFRKPIDVEALLDRIGEFLLPGSTPLSIQLPIN